MMLYQEEKDLEHVFAFIESHFSGRENVPLYVDEAPGIEKLRGVLNGVRSDTFYPTLVAKAAYLLIQINKGHFFSNGNKRIALVIAIAFLAMNDKQIAPRTKEFYRERLRNLFPTFNDFEDQEDFSTEEFALYNLSIIIADSHKYLGEGEKAFEMLKQKVGSFFAESIVGSYI